MSAAPMTRRAAVVAALLGFATAACDESPVGVDARAPEPCQLAALRADPAALSQVTAADYGAAIRDAEARLAAGLPASHAATELRDALTGLATSLGDARWDTACRLGHLATDALERLDDVPETRPDRSALRHLLDVIVAGLTLRPA